MSRLLAAVRQFVITVVLVVILVVYILGLLAWWACSDLLTLAINIFGSPEAKARRYATLQQYEESLAAEDYYHTRWDW